MKSHVFRFLALLLIVVGAGVLLWLMPEIITAVIWVLMVVVLLVLAWAVTE